MTIPAAAEPSAHGVAAVVVGEHTTTTTGGLYHQNPTPADINRVEVTSGGGVTDNNDNQVEEAQHDVGDSNTDNNHNNDDDNRDPAVDYYGEDDSSCDGEAATDDDAEDDVETGRRNTKKKKKYGCYIKSLLGFLLLAFIIYVIVDFTTQGPVRAGIDTFMGWIEQNPGPGVVLFILLYFVATIFFFPGAVLTLGSGFIFAAAFGLGGGIALATLAVFVGASLGSTVAFLLGRYLLREQMLKLSKRYTLFEALDAALSENGLKIMALLRLSPIIPFNVINYLAGVSSISLRDYVLTLIAILPGTVMYVFLGASAGSLAETKASGSTTTVTIIVIVLGIVFGMAAICFTTRYAKKELNRLLEERQSAGETDATDLESGTGNEYSGGNAEDLQASSSTQDVVVDDS